MGAGGQFARGAEESADGGFVLQAGSGFDAGAGVEARGEDDGVEFVVARRGAHAADRASGRERRCRRTRPDEG